LKNFLDELAKSYPDLYGRPRFFCDWVAGTETTDKGILNIGCGHGWFERFTAENLNVRRAVGLEVSEGDLKPARRLPKYRGVEFVVADALSLPYEDGSFDICVSSDVIEHIPKNTEPQFMAEAFRILKPGGRFYLTTPADNWLSKFSDPAWYLVGHRHYSKEKLVGFAQNVGFVFDDAAIKGAWWDLIQLWNLYVSKWIFRRTPFFEGFIAPRVNSEYQADNGFMTLCCVFRKSS